MGNEYRQKGTKRKLATNYQVATDRKEKEGNQLIQEVIEKFNEEFPLIDLEADIVNRAQKMGKTAQLQF